MKRKVLRAIISCIIIIMLLAGTVPVLATENSTTGNSQSVNEANSLIDGIVTYKLKESGATSIQQWIDGSLANNAGTTAEFYVIALSQNGEYNFANYEKALLKYLADNQINSASSRQKYALALIAAGSDNQYIKATLDDSIGKQGVMSWAYGLHLLNNGYSSSGYTLQEVKEKLLSLQFNDGGWAVMGTSGDVDVTAMVIQALAPHYNSDTAVKASVNSALTLLSERQQATGDYASYGVSNPESTAQVLVALSSLGIDAASDNRFIKNGNTLFDGMDIYRLGDGTFCHQAGGDYNENATVQVFCSMVSYLRMKSEKTPFYVLDVKDLEGGSEEESSAAVLDDVQTPPVNNYKIWVSFAIVIVAGLVCGGLHIAKKGTVKNYILVGAIAAVAVIVIWVTDFQSVDGYYEEATASKENVVGTVTLAIRCDTIAGKGGSEYVPADGVILEAEEYSIEEGDTVYDVLLEATAKHKIHVETTGGPDSVYVQGINHIYEFSHGDLSGWLYYVNGETSSLGCGEYKLSDGDIIQWLYTCEMGKDIE